jgi:hypothetical protein
MKFNLNYKVRIKLNDRGREILREQHDELYKIFVERGVKKPEYRPKTEDADGWSEWQLWDVMGTFGAYISLGSLPPFETEIDIPEGQR